MNTTDEQTQPAESTRPPFLPYPKLGANLDGVPIHVRPDAQYYEKRMGFLPDTIKLYLHVPWAAEYLFRLNNAIMRDERNALGEEEKYELALIASRDNDCSYCTSHHVGTLKKRFGLDEARIESVLRLEAAADGRAALAREFVHQASVDAAGVTDELRSRMARAFSPQEYMEIVLVVGFWKMYNTMHTAMGIESEPPVIAYKKFVEVPAGPR